MAKTVFLEGASGISGDMTVGALLDLGGNEEKMRAALASMPFDGYSIAVEKTTKWGLAGTAFHVHLHAHEHADSHHHHHHHEHRHLADVEALLAAGNLTARARTLASRAFRIVAEAEAKAHGTALETVHFHEVGAVDSICDIVAACVLADDLGIDDCTVTGLSEGAGFISCAHGALPVPVPAVLNVAEAAAIPLRLGTAETELVTPTGIALAAALRTRSALPSVCRVVKTGIGFGTREIGRANCLRALVLETDESAASSGVCADAVTVFEANVDDMTGEELGVALEAFFAAGARDCHFTPCFMKKNRPGWLVRVLADETHRAAVEATFFRATSTIGVRRHRADRTTLPRACVCVAVAGGEVEVKKTTFDGQTRFRPEADSVKRVAAATGRSFREVYVEAENRARA